MPSPAPANKVKTRNYAIIGGGVALVAAFILYERKKAAAASAATSTSGGGSVPTALIASTGTSGPTTLSGWIQQAVGTSTGAGYTATQSLNDINSWLAGQCVSANGYKAIGNLIETLGLPPGFSTVPVLSVCASAATTTTTTTGSTGATSPATAPPNLSAGVVAAMTANGEKLIGSPQFDSKLGEWLYATDKGGVYALNPNGSNGATFYGSYLGLPASGRQGGARTFAGFQINPNTGYYTLTDTAGENYTFTPTTPQGG